MGSIRPLSSMLPLQSTSKQETVVESCRRQQYRNMVMVTNTKASELPTETEGAGSPSFDPSEFKVLSEDLIVTPSSLSRVEKLIKQRQDKSDGGQHFLRVYVDAGGCSGFQYQFELDEEYDPDEDITLVAAGDGSPRVVVDETSLEYLKGSTLDYVQEMIKSSFVIADNPQSESACGCGSSFAVKNFAANPALD